MNTKNVKNTKIVILFAITSLALLYLSNDIILFNLTLIIYILLLSKKLFSFHIKKYSKIAISITLLTSLCFVFTFTIAQPHLLHRLANSDEEVSFMKNRLNNSNFIGNSNLTENESTQYYYMNFSNYSFIYLIEQYGKIIGITIITIFVLLYIAIITSYRHINDEFGKFLIIGVGSFIFIQIFVSILTMLGLVNIEMINMPFITHNDSSIILFMTAISLIISICGRRNLCQNEI